MSFGNDTLVFKHLVKVGEPDSRGQYQMNEVDTSAPGCRHRPLTFQETVDAQLDIATEWWRTTMPLKDYDENLIAAVTSMQPQDSFMVGGTRFQIHGGVRPHPDMASVPFKMTIISKLQKG